MPDGEPIGNGPADDPQTLSELLDLHSAEGFRMESGAVSPLTTRFPTTVVLFAGTAESGKTTLLATLYLLLQKGPFAGFAFAGSQTLMGFERRVHSARLASRLRVPDTERTKFSEYLHLRVRPVDRSGAARDLLFCDLLGEDFRDAKDSADGCKRLSILRRADRLVLLVDGDKLRSIETRQTAKNDPISLMRNVTDCRMLAETAVVDVVFTKWDLVGEGDDQAASEAFAIHVEDELKRQFLSRVGSLKFARVAAHATGGTAPLGHGLADLAQDWFCVPIGRARHRIRAVLPPPQAAEFDKYLLRRLASEKRP